MKGEIQFSDVQNPDTWEPHGSIEFASNADAKHAEQIFNALQKETAHLRNLLAECHDFISDQSDVRDGDEGDGPRPNKAMSLCQLIEPELPKVAT